MGFKNRRATHVDAGTEVPRDPGSIPGASTLLGLAEQSASLFIGSRLCAHFSINQRNQDVLKPVGKHGRKAGRPSFIDEAQLDPVVKANLVFPFEGYEFHSNNRFQVLALLLCGSLP
jgi:hypothetical protein